MKQRTFSRAGAAAVLLLVTVACAGGVKPPRHLRGDADRDACRRIVMRCHDFTEVDSLEDRYRLHTLLLGQCEPFSSTSAAPPDAAYSLLTYRRYPLMAWHLHECRLVGEEEARSVMARWRTARSTEGFPWDPAVAFALPVVVALIAFVDWIRDARRRARGDAGGSPTAVSAGGGRRKLLLYRVLLGVYGGCGAVLVRAALDGAFERIAVYVAIALLTGACFVRGWARAVVGVIAGSQIALTIVLHATLLEEVMDSMGPGGIPALLACNLVLPAAILASTSGKAKAPVALNLPPGYDFTLTRKRGLTPMWRIVAAVCMIVIGTAVFLGGPGGLLLFAVFVMPVIIVAYLVFHFLTGRREDVPAAQRRFRLSPKMVKPAQTRHYWTVDDSQFQDRELFEQDDPRARISSEPEDDSTGGPR